MPGGKRVFEDFDPNKSDPEDSDYDAAAARSRPSKSSRSQRGKPSPRKRQRTAYGADGSEDISESELSENSLEDEREAEEPEMDPKTGRPVRKATKKRVTYEESDQDSEAFLEELIEEPPKKKPRIKQSLILKLPANPALNTKRSTRARSVSIGLKKPSTTEVIPTRRSSRIAHDESETIIALTDSGRHADIVRVGTRSPEGVPPRAFKGGKGLKKPPSSAIFEDEENLSQAAKAEPVENIQYDSLSMDEIAASREDLGDDNDVALGQNVVEKGASQEQDEDVDQTAIIPESGEDAASEDDDDEPVKGRPRRSTRRSGSVPAKEQTEVAKSDNEGRSRRRALRSSAQSQANRSSQRSKKRSTDESSDFEPITEEGAEENVSDSEASHGSPRKASQQNDDDDSSNARRSGRLGKKPRSRRDLASDEHDSEVAEELAEELENLRTTRPRRAARQDILFDDKPNTRKRKPVDYRILPPDFNNPIEEDGPPSANTPSRKGRGAGAGVWQRSLFSTYGPFGGAGGPPPVFGGPGGVGAIGGVDSDSSDDDAFQRPRLPGTGGTVGMTPVSAAPAGFGLFPPAQVHGADPLQVSTGTPANLGKIKDKQALADADPLGVDQNVNFDSVGGLQDHIDRLKEMVALPLLYPEIFQRFHVTPPRGVLFHGPPGTGKTLLARALASSVSSQGRKVTFYMRKGADALSKWVGEAERQLRLLFEEARKTQPSIIFFDEIDGLAPVRSSKQEQIHASIVSTLLALMDGMDGRGQVIVIGATNRPDSIDPALRRPGRFDREFYFPLPSTEGRRAILDIHTKGWQPPVPHTLKDELAELTKGYGGADLRALCTEAALNAVQRRYPQIYKSNEKLQIKPETINITPKDFMISIKKIVPSSERSASSGATPLPKTIAPLLRYPLQEIENILSEVLPQKKHLTALEEAEFEDANDDRGMGMERVQQEFERSRVFRPRLLIRGTPGMGQQYVAGALLNHFEGLHVQSFDLPTLLSDSTRSMEAAVVQLFTEVRRHKPSVIYIPNVDIWYRTVGDAVISTFLGLLRSLSPTEPILLLGVMECDDNHVDPMMIKELFGYSKKNQYVLQKPTSQYRREYFEPIQGYLEKAPTEFPDPADRKKRVFETLAVVPPEPPKAPEPPSKEELKAQKKKDRQTLNILKLQIGPIMEQVKLKYKKFRAGVIDETQIRYLYEEEDPAIVSTDLPHDQRSAARFRPYEKGYDDHGEPGLIEQASNKFFYNLEIVTIEKRLSNGYYKRPKDFLSDIKKLTKDAKAIGDADRLLKANELQANVEVDIENPERIPPTFAAECEAVYEREKTRENEKIEKARQLAIAEGRRPEPIVSNMPPGDTSTTDNSSGPIVLGQPIANGIVHHPVTPTHHSDPSTLTNGFSNGISDLSNLDGHKRESNGTSAPSNRDEARGTNSQDQPSTERETQGSSFGPSAQTHPVYSYTGGPGSLQHRLSYPGSLSQRSAITPMAEGSNPNMYSNDASTTSSEKRMTGSSGITQSTQNKGEGPDLSVFPHPPSANSQLPDTQGSQISLRTNSEHSSQPPVPPFSRPATINSLLNATPEVPPAAITPRLSIDHHQTMAWFEELIEATSPCSVEQLEQVYSAIMAEVWATRGSWNRLDVLDQVRRKLDDVMTDIEECQDIGMDSQQLLENGQA